MALVGCAAGFALDHTSGMSRMGDWRSAFLTRWSSVTKEFDKVWLVIAVRLQGKFIHRVRHTTVAHCSLHDAGRCIGRAVSTCALSGLCCGLNLARHPPLVSPLLSLTMWAR